MTAAEFMREWRQPTGERYRPRADLFGDGLVEYLDYQEALPAGSRARVVVFVDDLGLGPHAFDGATIERLFDPEGAEQLWISPTVRDRPGESGRKHTIRAMLSGGSGAEIGLLLLVETDAPGLWHLAWRRARRAEP